ncbi:MULTISPECIES: TetR/AcrR family transcriptional regulator [Gracilibacillus]|uniref:TetR/AcrR family transcriptional regulator n=1 Tax=Gracilibacillus TaxID=74385 RepID=UPI0008244C3D|nr:MULTISPECIES: TetR/AcrR family transcriptional regulator [Gracilibacillus]
MDSKKERIIQESVKLFSEKGFHATSIQEIASRSDVSKGAFYLHFVSKDDLLVDIFKYYTDMLMGKIGEIKQTADDPSKQFAQQIEVFLQIFNEHREYILIQIRNQVHLGDKMDQLIFNLHKESFEWMREQLFLIYGEQITPYIVDIAIQLEGMMSSYMQWSVLHDITFVPSRLADYIVNQIDCLVRQVITGAEKPIFCLEDLSRFYVEETQGASQIIEEMKQMMKKTSSKEKQQMEEALQALEEEIEKQEPRQIIIQSMLAHLESYPSFYTAVQKLKKTRGDMK